MKTAILHGKNERRKNRQKGFSIPELIVVLLIIAILVVLALPQLASSRRALRFTGLQRLTATTLTEARQEAMSQRTPIKVRYDDAAKTLTTYGGSFGAAGNERNRSVELFGSGLTREEMAYGRPGGAPVSALADTANLTNLTSGEVVITFQADGSVIDAANNPQNNALFFYNVNYPNDMAFAVSILGAGGRVKVWRYNKDSNSYVE